jgi:cell division topological specificity factor
MNFMSFFKRSSSAPVARERLQILLAHERAVVGKSDLIAVLQDEMLAVIARHFPLDSDAIKIKVDRGDAISTLEVEVEIPTPMCANLGLDKEKSLAPTPKPDEIDDGEPASIVEPRERRRSGGDPLLRPFADVGDEAAPTFRA